MRRFLCLLMASRASSRRPAALLLRRPTAPRRAPRRATRLGAAAPDVARVAARDFSPADAAALVAPVVLTGVLDDGACEAWCDALLTQAGDLEVLSQLQPREGAPTSPSTSPHKLVAAQPNGAAAGVAVAAASEVAALRQEVAELKEAMAKQTDLLTALLNKG